jgi:hypothetical protein
VKQRQNDGVGVARRQDRWNGNEEQDYEGSPFAYGRPNGPRLEWDVRGVGGTQCGERLPP